MKVDVVIVGTGGMAKEVWGMLADMGHNILGFVVKPNDPATEFMGLSVLGDDNWLMDQKGLNVVVANGNPATRQRIFERLRSRPLFFPSIVHPNVTIFKRVTWRGGCTIMPGSVIQPDVIIGFGCHLNMGVTIGHDVTIGDYSVVNHSAGISGNITIGNGVLVGAGATLIEHHNIGQGCTIGAGAVLTKDVPAGETWVGVPARPMLPKVQTYAELYGVQ